MLRATVGKADLTLVLTDDDGVKHELAAAPLQLESPVWLVHLGGVFPAAYADVVTDVEGILHLDLRRLHETRAMDA